MFFLHSRIGNFNFALKTKEIISFIDGAVYNIYNLKQMGNLIAVACLCYKSIVQYYAGKSYK